MDIAGVGSGLFWGMPDRFPPASSDRPNGDRRVLGGVLIHTSRSYRLPTEAEWEYACRAGTKTPFHFGKTLTTEVANYDGDYIYADGPKGEYLEKTTPVDQFDIANAYGLCDMHGNVWEWCQDHWHDNYDGAPIDGRAWLTDNEQAERILRGGSWIYLPEPCRSARRNSTSPEDRDNDLGFRVVSAPPRSLP
ncbi:MAG: formylglycine-generating enzyme family protein [Cyanobacteria bacterium J06636_28]